MSSTNSVVSIFADQDQAEAAIKTLQAGGIALTSMSLVGRGFHSEQHVVGYYTAGDRMKVWGGTGAFRGGMWGLLFGSAFFWVPGVGPLMLAGPRRVQRRVEHREDRPVKVVVGPERQLQRLPHDGPRKLLTPHRIRPPEVRRDRHRPRSLWQHRDRSARSEHPSL